MASTRSISYWTIRRDIKKELAKTVQQLESCNNSFECYVNSNTGDGDSCSSTGSHSLTDYDFCVNVDGACNDDSADDITDSNYDEYSASAVNLDNSINSLDNDSDDETDRSTAEDSTPLIHTLAWWAVHYGVTRVAVGALLKLLKPFHPELPLDECTLLHSKSHSDKIKTLVGGGQYIHLGFEHGILNLVRSGSFGQTARTLDLQFNVDGLPLFKSNNTALWPILCLVCNSNCRKPFVVGCFCGESKPSNLQAFFSDFVYELNSLLLSGLTVDDVHYDVNIHSFVCDAPARAMVKNVKGHSGYSGCEKCHVEGEWHGKVTFQDTNANLRTDSKFNDMTDTDHHLGCSAISDMSVGMVSQFPLDYMHLVCLGVVKRLLLCWLKGPLVARLPAARVDEISDRLFDKVPYIPREFARKPRSLKDVARW